MNFEKGINRIILFLSGLIGCCFFLINIDYILTWDRSGGIIPFPAFCILISCSLICFTVSFFVFHAIKCVSKWVAEGFTS